ncbi:MAG: Rrf2 family transcriptional regulator [Candidatus Hydrogenedentes bacterium]|nr:Rrf2 family transcriptional regulator [Candidatus Hydrogenedentota bacterium]
MHLTHYTDYALRTLIFLAAKDGPSTIAEVASRFRISRNHLVKVVHSLGKTGLIKTERGKLGGIRLAMPADQIMVGDVVRKMEVNFHLVECFCPAHNQCPITPVCDLKRVLEEAFENFMTVLDRYSVADMVGEREPMLALLQTPESNGSALKGQAAAGVT